MFHVIKPHNARQSSYLYIIEIKNKLYDTRIDIISGNTKIQYIHCQYTDNTSVLRRHKEQKG